MSTRDEEHRGGPCSHAKFSLDVDFWELASSRIRAFRGGAKVSRGMVPPASPSKPSPGTL